MTDAPRITIAITCYNATDSISRAIESAIAQTWGNTEILIADDCSTDNSRDVIRQKISNLPNARLIENEINLGPGGTRNILLDAAQGEFIAFFDDDDESLPQRIETQYNRITTYEQDTGERIVACYASGIRNYPNGYKKELPAIGSQPIVPKGEDLADSVLFYGRRDGWFYGSGTPTCSLMARVSVLKEAGGFDKNFRRVEDLDLSIRLALKGANFIGCPETLFIQHATIGTDKTSDKNLQAELQLAEKHKAFLSGKGMYVYATNWPKLRHYHFTKNYLMFAATLLYLIARYPVKTIAHLLDTGPKRLKHEKKMTA